MFSDKQLSAENIEEVDEDIAVTQSQTNFICPLTQVHQLFPLIFLPSKHFSSSKVLCLCLITHRCPTIFKVEMVNPMKNKKCNHHYDEKAILDLIKTKGSQKKRCR